MPFSVPHGLPGLIRRRCWQFPDQPVCADEDRQLTGRELELASDAMARDIAEVAERRGPVVLRLRRGVNISIAMLGVLKAGCAYMPVDPEEPSPRVAAMLRQGRPVAAVVDDLDGMARDWELPLLKVPDVPLSDADPAPLSPVDPSQAVYVMFTSGSTGEPKGVILGSGALCNRLLWMQSQYPLTERDRILQKTPYTFDPSGWEIFWPLLAAGRCEFAPHGAHRDPAWLARIMAERGITICHFVPSMLEEFLRCQGARRLTALRRVFCSGERLSAQLARHALDQWPQATLHNLYGPTEAAIDVTYWDVPSGLDPAGVVAIGHPVANTLLRVADAAGEPAAPGQSGELWISGAQLAIGYAGRPDLTARSFPVRSGQRWYRTGDIVVHTPDGLVYLGREDNQVKIQGVRVEPLEVERVASEVASGVCVVPVREAAGVVLLAVLPRDSAVTDQQVLDHVATRLPAAFHLAGVCRLGRLPLAGNGKLDRRRLADLAERRWKDAKASALAGDFLATAWARALSTTAKPGETEGFLRAGGTSLGAIRLLADVREATGVEIPLAPLLDGDLTLAGLRSLVAGAVVSAAPPRDAGASPPYGGPSVPPDRSPLAPEQRRLWFLSRLNPDSAAYNVTVVLRLSGELEVPALRAALDATVARHDILRASVADEPGQGPCLRYDPTAVWELQVVPAPAPLTRAAVEAFALQAAREPISHRRAPMARARVLRYAPAGESCLVLVFNHLVADQHTIDIILADTAAAYSAVLTGRPTARAAAPRYAEYAYQAAEGAHDLKWSDDIAYWRQRLNGAPPELSLPFRLAGTQSWRGFEGAATTRRLGEAFSARLEAYRRTQSATLTSFFLSVFAFVLAAWSGQDTVIIGIPGSRRRTAREQAQAGFLIDTLPIRIDLDGLQTFSELLHHVRTRRTEAMEHARPTFDEVTSGLRLGQRSIRNPVFQVWLNDLSDVPGPPVFAGLGVEPLLAPVHSALFDLGLYLYKDAEGLIVQLVRATDQYSAEVASDLLAQCMGVAGRILADPAIALGDIDLVTNEARARLPDPAKVLPPAGQRIDVTADVAAVVALTPTATAVTGPGGSHLSYGQMWRAANAVAAELRATGVTPGDTVLLDAARHPGFPVALLGCWLAGACAALADAELPPWRRARLARSSRARFVLSVTGSVDRVASVDHTGGRAADPGFRAEPPVQGGAPGLSHILFTSGSTGQPVPVGIGHGPLRDFLRWYRDTFELQASDRFALLAGTGHDPILREIFAAFTVGACLCIPPPDFISDLPGLPAWLNANRVTVLHATPALAELLVDAAVSGGARLGSIRLVVLGGAPLTASLARRIREVTGAEIVNAYGTTETPQIVSCRRWQSSPQPPDGAQVPVGAGCGGSQVLVMTRAGRLAGIGQRGEVVVRSRNLAAGYLDGNARGQAFDDDPVPGVRIFHTGDMGRFDPGGSVVLDGRRDRQVSVGGHRLELGEVEATALRHPAVRQAIAAVAGGTSIPAVTLQVTADLPLSVEELRDFLARSLPPYALPTSIRVVDSFALNAAHKAVARPVATSSWSDEDADQLTAGSAVIARIQTAATELLGRPLGLDENFFESGLNSVSLLALHHAGTAGIAEPFPVTALFAYPNLRALARYLRSDQWAGPRQGPRPAAVSPRRPGQARRELRRWIRGEAERP